MVSRFGRSVTSISTIFSTSRRRTSPETSLGSSASRRVTRVRAPLTASLACAMSGWIGCLNTERTVSGGDGRTNRASTFADTRWRPLVPVVFRIANSHGNGVFGRKTMYSVEPQPICPCSRKSTQAVRLGDAPYRSGIAGPASAKPVPEARGCPQGSSSPNSRLIALFAVSAMISSPAARTRASTVSRSRRASSLCPKVKCTWARL